MSSKYWLLKAEPDSRIVKGKDVKFSVDDFEAIQISPWEGVRNYEARNLMQEMKIGEKALFYHSNCKNPGIAAFAEVVKEAYPDHTAWDESHPYFDPKTNKEKPKWFMVDLQFKSRAAHFIPLSLLKQIAKESEIPEKLEYIGEKGLQAIKSMPLVRRGRLSVQRVDESAWNTIVKMAERGGWDVEVSKKRGKKAKKGEADEGEDEDEDSVVPGTSQPEGDISQETEELEKSKSATRSKRKTRTDEEAVVPTTTTRRTRSKKK